MRKIILTLVLITFISGCTIPDVLKQVMPGFEEQEVKELPPDIITIQNLNVIPTPPINAEDQFSVSFIVKNQDDINDVDNVEYNLFDTGLCNLTADSTNRNQGSLNTLVPLQEEFIEWDLKAPTNDQIAQISTRCPIRFKIDYDFISRSQIDVVVIDEERLKELQRSGEGATFTPTLTVGRGPVKIYLSFGASLPLKEGNTLPLYLMVEDKGNGLFGQIEEGTLTIEATGFSVVEGNKNFKNLVNNATIPLIRKKTPQMRFVLKPTGDIAVEKTFYITASLNYRYSLSGETEVAIKPTA